MVKAEVWTLGNKFVFVITAGRFAAGIEKAFFLSHSERLKRKIYSEWEIICVWKKIVTGAPIW